MSERTPLDRVKQVLQTGALDIREGFVVMLRHSLALLGLSVMVLLLAFAGRPELRTAVSEKTMAWLQSQLPEVAFAGEDFLGRSLASDLKGLNPDQVAVARWLSRRYKIAAEPLAALITEADTLGASTQLPPNLILAIMAVESSFNPYAMGTKGAMGLMQIVPSQLKSSLSNFGGELATYDPLTNMRLGTRQLQSLVQDSGSLEVGILRYGEQSGQPDLKNYLQRVASEYLQLEKVSRQDPVPELLGIAPHTS
jgi:hypothetical protein